MSKNVEYGVFLPVGSGGWIPSKNAPVLDGSYAYNRDVTVLSEELGFHFVLSQAVWRGHGGETQHFDHNLESLTTAAGLGEATESIGLWGTVNTALLHPAVAAKMLATSDQINGGRSGLNIVAGGNRASERQMGIGLDLDNPDKYRRATEWIQCVKRLWTEESVTFDGEFFQLDDCQSSPKPVAGMPRLICAATSDSGMDFVARNMDGVMFEGITDERVIELGQRARQISADVGRPLQNMCIFMLVPAATDEEAAARVALYQQDKDLVALNNMAAEFGMKVIDPTSNDVSRHEWMREMALSTRTIAGSPQTIAARLEHLIDAADLDSVIFIMPDFVADLRMIGQEVLPILERDGYGTRLATAFPALASS